mmetsp:Transcript_43054/g.131100  ORF Transcript_43054/g.131100 Transcript_43054/m.131100 type:complete len:666 (+) Transcript_43054:391-2388(+)
MSPPRHRRRRPHVARRPSPRPSVPSPRRSPSLRPGRRRVDGRRRRKDRERPPPAGHPRRRRRHRRGRRPRPRQGNRGLLRPEAPVHDPRVRPGPVPAHRQPRRRETIRQRRLRSSALPQPVVSPREAHRGDHEDHEPRGRFREYRHQLLPLQPGADAVRDVHSDGHLLEIGDARHRHNDPFGRGAVLRVHHRRDQDEGDVSPSTHRGERRGGAEGDGDPGELRDRGHVREDEARGGGLRRIEAGIQGSEGGDAEHVQRPGIRAEVHPPRGGVRRSVHGGGRHRPRRSAAVGGVVRRGPTLHRSAIPAVDVAGDDVSDAHPGLHGPGEDGDHAAAGSRGEGRSGRRHVEPAYGRRGGDEAQRRDRVQGRDLSLQGYLAEEGPRGEARRPLAQGRRGREIWDVGQSDREQKERKEGQGRQECRRRRGGGGGGGTAPLGRRRRRLPLLLCPRGKDSSPRRQIGLRQDDHSPPRAPSLRRRLGLGHHRRSRRPLPHPGKPPAQHRSRRPGNRPLERLRARQRQVRPSRRVRRRGVGRAEDGRARRLRAETPRRPRHARGRTGDEAVRGGEAEGRTGPVRAEGSEADSARRGDVGARHRDGTEDTGEREGGVPGTDDAHDRASAQHGAARGRDYRPGRGNDCGEGDSRRAYRKGRTVREDVAGSDRDRRR